jgi:DNA-directed RNA polymerase specialized sigma24 family protein
MADDGSVTRLLGQIRAGGPDAAPGLWERYFRRLVGLARQKLQGAPQRAADAEDVALSAFDSFYRAAEQGRFPDLHDRDGLWRLLVVLTARKAAHLRRNEGRRRETDDAAVLAEECSREPTPERAAQAAEECRRLLGRLRDPVLVAVALARLEGRSVDEIAQQLRCVPRSVKRKLKLIRNIWGSEAAP